MESAWINIINDIQNVDVIYMAIGCSMGHYKEITQTNNQQYPCFLDKFKKKLIILVDPILETPLKIQEQITDLNEIKTNDYRILKNDSLIIYAINKSFYYVGTYYNGYDNSKIKNSDTESEINFRYLLQIIQFVLDMKIKFIFQDYSGTDPTNFYFELMKIFDSDELLKYVTFDVTQKDAGCFIDINPNIIKYDSDDNFIQEKFLPLEKINKLDTFRDILKLRIDLLNYQLLWTYNKSLDTNEWKPFDTDKIMFLCVIYNFDTRFLDYNVELIKAIDCIRDLMIIIIKDIVKSLCCEEELVTYLINNISNRTDFVNMTSMLKQFN